MPPLGHLDGLLLRRVGVQDLERVGRADHGVQAVGPGVVGQRRQQGGITGQGVDEGVRGQPLVLHQQLLVHAELGEGEQPQIGALPYPPTGDGRDRRPDTLQEAVQRLQLLRQLGQGQGVLGLELVRQVGVHHDLVLDGPHPVRCQWAFLDQLHRHQDQGRTQPRDLGLVIVPRDHPQAKEEDVDSLLLYRAPGPQAHALKHVLRAAGVPLHHQLEPVLHVHVVRPLPQGHGALSKDDLLEHRPGGWRHDLHRRAGLEVQELVPHAHVQQLLPPSLDLVVQCGCR